MATAQELDIPAPPDIPSKWDIIPIHASDVSSYLRCRRYWNWSSPARNNLRTRADVSGVNPALWFGTGIHWTLEQYYDPMLRRHPVEAWQTWFHLQWYGGDVEPEFVEQTYDNNPHKMADGTYKIRGLQDILPQYDEEEYFGYRDLGTGMMNFYYDYARENDDFQVIARESVFSIPLGFEAIDTREDSPNYGKKSEVHARGKRDTIIYWPHRDAFGVRDHKTAAKVDEDYFSKLDSDPQVSTYLWASREEAKIHDLPWKNIDECLYEVLRKKFPTPPTMLKNGTPSISRTDEAATAKMFNDYIEEHNLRVWYDANEKAQNYYNWLIDQGDRRFIERKTTFRSQNFMDNTGKHLREIAEEMLDPNLRLYPRYTNDNMCLKCAFRAPCLATEDGSDPQFILDNNYETNRGR
jgi:hypothetical protein